MPIIDTEAYERYSANNKKCKSNKDAYKVSNGFYKSLVDNISLEDFTCFRLVYCKANHSKDCMECSKLVDCAKDILNYGVVELKQIFHKNFKQSKYISNKVIRRMMQMPVVVFMLELSGPGSQKLFITENNPSVDYSVFVKSLKFIVPVENVVTGLSKDQLRALCSLATTEKDRKLIKVAACQSKGLSEKKSNEAIWCSQFEQD